MGNAYKRVSKETRLTAQKEIKMKYDYILSYVQDVYPEMHSDDQSGIISELYREFGESKLDRMSDAALYKAIRKFGKLIKS